MQIVANDISMYSKSTTNVVGIQIHVHTYKYEKEEEKKHKHTQNIKETSIKTKWRKRRGEKKSND